MKAYNTPKDELHIESDTGETLVSITPEKTTIANLEGSSGLPTFVLNGAVFEDDDGGDNNTLIYVVESGLTQDEAWDKRASIKKHKKFVIVDGDLSKTSLSGDYSTINVEALDTLNAGIYGALAPAAIFGLLLIYIQVTVREDSDDSYSVVVTLNLSPLQP